MPKLIPIADRNPKNRCWFCMTDKSVKYTAKITNPYLTKDGRTIDFTLPLTMDILVCSKCAAIRNLIFIKED